MGLWIEGSRDEPCQSHAKTGQFDMLIEEDSDETEETERKKTRIETIETEVKENTTSVTESMRNNQTSIWCSYRRMRELNP